MCSAATITGTIELKRADRSGVVVWLEPLDNAATSTPSTATAHERLPHARMLQKDKRFQPHVLAISAGTTVDFPNADPIFHNAFSNFNGQIFDIGLYPPGKSRSIVFRNPGVVHVFCNIHPSMAAVIVVTKSPFFGVTNASGQYTIPSVPPGQYNFRVFSERSTPESLNASARTVVVSEPTLSLPRISLPEAGYIAAPHNNKYGRPYPPGAGEPSTYTVPQ